MGSEFVGHIHLITLEETPERSSIAHLQLAEMLDDAREVCAEEYSDPRVIVHTFNRHPTSPSQGRIDSHVEVCRRISKNPGTGWHLILEDNIKYSRDAASTRILSSRNILEMFKKFKNTHDLELVCVGGYILRWWGRSEQIFRVGSAGLYETFGNNHGAVAYIVKPETCRNIVRDYDSNLIQEHYDIYISKRFRTFITSNFLFFHHNSIRSNINRNSGGWRRVWFHPIVMSNVHVPLFFAPKVVKLAVIVAILSAVYVAVFRSSRRCVVNTNDVRQENIIHIPETDPVYENEYEILNHPFDPDAFLYTNEDDALP